MVASMIGLGPHEVTGWLWAHSFGLVVVLVALAAFSFNVALRSAAGPSRAAAPTRINPYPVSVVHADTTKIGRPDNRGS